MPPFQQLFSSNEFWTSVIVALVSGGGVGGLIGAWSSRRKDAADVARMATDILTKDVVQPLRDQLDYQESQITHLETVQERYFKSVAYTRRLFHWLQDFCELVNPDFLARHPKPALPDELRADVAPETIAAVHKDIRGKDSIPVIKED
ncbi:PRTRC system protein E [Bifidobacterium eulemuris]|uniref:PRTRC system protein E n=1 Tax=Bifidobacterium eulemuris TaxID=1765219 RepID=A0A261GBD0_9BIFI|nr:PRTRC system protein E [Bifidobacterium eulemuris]OZG68286.1 PRTRC system protein E [Bifidobacterium eulemuris]QOL31660.1 PRTRC system protein E [Bifidobacterium eulemuris]